MKRFGLVIAILTEVKALLNTKFKFETLEEKPFTVYKTIINDNELIIIHSGCGEILASAATQHLITKYNVDYIFNYGICGALRDDLNTLDTCIVKSIINYDFDTDAIDHLGVGYHYEMGELYLKPDQELIEKALKIVNLPLYVCASGDKFVDNNEERDYLKNTFKADICEMESAGIFMVSKLNNKPCLFIKGVSDSYKGMHQEYETMAKESAKIAVDIFLNIIENF